MSPTEIVHDSRHPLNLRLVKLAIQCGAVVNEDPTGHSARVELRDRSWTVTCGATSFEALLGLGRWIAWTTCGEAT